MRSNYVRTAVAVLATAASVAALSACGTPGADKSSGTDSSGNIKIALIDAQSGSNSDLGGWEHDGVQLAVDQQNAAGGIDGRKITLTQYDDQNDPTTGTSLATKAVGGGFAAVMGSTTSGVALAISPILTKAKIPEMTSGSSPDLPKTGSKFLFLNSPPSTVFDKTLANYAVKTKKFTRIAMISNNGAYGTGEHDAFKASLGSLGQKPVSDQVVTPTQTNFSAALTTIRGKQPDALFIGAEEVESGLIAKQARQLGIKATIVGGAPISTPTYVKTAGTANAEGSIASTPYLSNDATAATKKFAAAYKAKFGEEPEGHGAKAYDGAKIVLAGLKATKGVGGQKLADAMRATNYTGLQGTFKYDDTGVGLHATQIGVVRNGKIVAAQS